MNTGESNDVEIYLVEELVEEFDVDEHGRGIRQLIGHDVEEGFGT